jgi:predicted nucleotidyltransferase
MLEVHHLSSHQILETLARKAPQLRRLGVRRIGLFGSFRRGDQRYDSDLDFLVILDHPTFDRYMDTKFFLEISWPGY